MKLNITIVEGGERLYVTPIVLKSQKDKFLPLLLQDGQVYEHDLVNGGSWYNFEYNRLSLFKKIILLFKKIRFVLQQKKLLCAKFKDISLIWRLTIFVYCNEILYDYFRSIHKQLVVVDEDHFSETYYLNPSKKYIAKVYQEEYPSEYQELVEKYGLDNLDFICELDT